MQIGFINRTPRGRCVTEAACRHLGYSMPNGDRGVQQSLF
jgi:Holliday junction DNA helicase RuvB